MKTKSFSIFQPFKGLLLTGLIMLLWISSVSCTKKIPQEEDTAISKTTYREKFRPQFHFSPKEKWMNDPNGMVYENGIYHLFYQHYPEDIVWGPMHWGHASSTDLIHWTHHDIALYPDELGYIFSGSAVVDKDNSSGLGKNGAPPLVAIYTYHHAELAKTESKVHQTQGIAYSNDHGKTWIKYDQNPVLENPGKRDFRDPKVFWHEETKQWIMTLAVGDHAEFYSSPNLKDWKFLSEFGKDKGAHGGVWECPDLIKMKVEGEESSKWALLISINPGGPNSGSATQYFIGDFDGQSFTTNQKDTKWIDHGADNYAGVTYSNAPDGKFIFIGWMSNWIYANNVPTKTWRSAMTLPRELKLKREGDDFFISSTIIPGFDKIGKTIREEETFVIDKKKTIKGDFQQAEISWMQKLNQGLTISFSNKMQEYLELSLNPESGQMQVDRSHSGLVDFNERFAYKPHVMPFLTADQSVDIRIVLDQSSIEIFMDKGRYVMTELFFPTEPYSEVTFSTTGNIQLEEFTIREISSIWKEE